MQNEKCFIDGSILEGGGQIIRTSLTCSSIFKIPLNITNIRGKRSKPGLQNQHLAGVKLLAEICNAKMNGDNLQSLALDFNPKKIASGNFEADSKTAGSVCLIMQAIIPTLLFASESSTLTLLGGTDAEFAPPINYYEQIVQFYMAKMGIEISIELVKRGFYPRGGGKVKIDIAPVINFVTPINLTERGEITSLRANCFVAGSLPISVAREMSDSLQQSIKSSGSKYRHLPIAIDAYKENPNKANGNGSGCMLLVETSKGCRFGFNLVGKREYSGSYMGTAVAKQFLEFFDHSEGCVDVHMQDQILVLMALAKGKSTIRCSELSLHSQTCIHVLEKMAGVQFVIEPVDGSKDVIVVCEGVGINNKDLAN